MSGITITLPSGVNGVHEVGIAAGADEVRDASMVVTIYLGATKNILIPETLAYNKNPGTTDLEKRVWQGMLAVILSNGWVCDKGPMHIFANAVTGKGRTGPEIDKDGYHDPVACANLIVGLKLTWWMTNHHVGQDRGTLASFIGKIATIQGLAVDGKTTETMRSILWTMGKITSTCGILTALGIPGIVCSNPDDSPVAPIKAFTCSEDVTLRVGANPAGTACLHTYAEAYKRAIKSVYSVALPPIPSHTLAVTTMADVKADPAAYHMGAAFLTGRARISCDVYDEADKAALSAFVHATAGGSTLAKAPSIMRKDEVVATTVYNSLVTIKNALTVNIASAETRAAIRTIVGGDAALGLAGTSGLINKAKYEAALKAVVAEDAAAAAKAAAAVVP